MSSTEDRHPWRRRDWVPLAALVLILSAIHVWWLLRFRRGFPLDIDESGYLWFSFVLHDAAREDGIVGLWRGFQSEGYVAPLLPAVTAILEAPAVASEVIPSLAVQLVFLGVLLIASYGIGRHLLDRRAGLLTALLVGTAPAVTDFVRTYHLVIPSTAMYTLATYALLASDRLRRRAWAVTWGVALGLTLLSRSMMLAFVPALVVAAVWMLAMDRGDRRKLVNLVLGLTAFAGTTLLWYATSWHAIVDYLVRAGYGDESSRYGRGLSPGSTEFWAHEVTGAVNGSLYVPLAGALLIAVVLAAAGGLDNRSRSRIPLAARWARCTFRAARSDAIVPVLVVVEGYLALTSSRNDGTGFVVPLLPCLIALAVVAVLRTRWYRVRAAMAATMVLVAVFNVVMKADVASAPSIVRSVQLPVFGPATLTNGQGYLHQHLVNAAAHELGPPTRWLPARDKKWLELYEGVAGYVDSVAARRGRVHLAEVEPLLNASALRLSAYRRGQPSADFGHVDTHGRDTVSAYRRFLRTESPDLLITASREGRQFGNLITQHLVEAAATSLGFERVGALPIPDGRELHLWAA